MKNILRILSLILVLVVVLGCFCACNDNKVKKEYIDDDEDIQSEEDESTESKESKASTKKNTTVKNKDRILKKDLSKYKFVVPVSASEELKLAAASVCSAAATKWESDSQLKTDDYATGAQEEYEILIGETNRTESSTYKGELSAGEGGYAIDGSKITILGYTEKETLSALDMFYFDRVMGSADNSIFFSDNDNLKEDFSKYISIMSFNVYVGIENDAAKKANVISLIREYSPDVFGVQEASVNWQKTLENEFSGDYHIVGEGREGNGNGEAMLIFANKSKFNIKTSGTKWLSSTPDTVSKVEGSACNRVVTYAVIERISDGKLFNYANTHIDHEGGQEEQIKYLGQIIDANMQSGIPTFVTGDFNTWPKSDPFNIMTGLGYAPSYDLAKNNQSKGVGTFNSSIIDYLFVRDGMGVDTYLYRVCNESDFGAGSDHYPVFTIVKF